MPGDPRQRCWPNKPPTLFQSAPDINAGRSDDTPIATKRAWKFQSAPDINAGRSPHRCPPPAVSACFNPRPTSMPGDPWPRGLWTQRLICFNPRPTSMPGDPRHVPLTDGLEGCFNPRPTSMPGDPWHDTFDSNPVEFQSAPDINAGRSTHRRTVQALRVSIRARHQCRAIRVPVKQCRLADVSIRARHQCRAIPAVTPVAADFNLCFNPRPTSMPGDPIGSDRLAVSRGTVSIRARHQCRAIPMLPAAIMSPVMFQSAPDINAGRSIRDLPMLRARSRVSIRARHQCRAIRSALSHARRQTRCFNPRPTSMPGDPRKLARTYLNSRRFQSAPDINAGRSTI